MSARYQIQALISESSRSRLFKGWDQEHLREVAIKQVANTDTRKVQELKHEAATLSLLRHPNIVSSLGTETSLEATSLVLEWIEGQTLATLVQATPLSPTDFGSLVRQTHAGLATVHQAGWLHLDLKPENLMACHAASGESVSSQWKILDFGLARPRSPAPRPQSDILEGIPGSIYFMAPEYFEKGILDVRTDLYALGATYYYALTGRYPFEGETTLQVVTSHRYHRHQPLAKLRPDLPVSWTHWVESLIQRQPHERPASVEASLVHFPQG